MLQNNNEQIRILRIEQQLLARQEGRHEISSEEYDKRSTELNVKIYNFNKEIINAEVIKRHEKEQKENQRRSENMIEEVKKKEVTKKVRGPKKDSYASLILEVLQKKTINNVEKATDAVMEKKPGREAAKVKAQIVVMINEVKKGKKPAYTWDDANFQLNLKV